MLVEEAHVVFVELVAVDGQHEAEGEDRVAEEEEKVLLGVKANAIDHVATVTVYHANGKTPVIAAVVVGRLL